MNAIRDDRYTYRVTWSEDDKEYVGLCAEFPSLSWLASTPEAALRGIRSVVADAVADMQKHREPIPEPDASRRQPQPSEVWFGLRFIFFRRRIRRPTAGAFIALSQAPV